MGCDIHAVFQARKDGQWVDVPSAFDEPRDYQLFGWLAGVRDTEIAPISPPRGLPVDFLIDDEMHPIASIDMLSPWRLKYRGANDPLVVWMGDHSHSWLLGSEILMAARGSVDAHGHVPTGIVECGYVDRETYNAWDGRSQPSEWCGGIGGPRIITARAGRNARCDVGNATHVWIEWETPLTARLHDFLQEIRRLVDLHGDVRMVFGFDS